MAAVTSIPLAHTIRPRAGSIQHSHFNFHSETERRISAAVLLCLKRGVQVEACSAATPGYLNAAGAAF